MKCVGTPFGPCPYNASGDNVHYRYAELDLCSPCEQEQRKATMLAKQGNTPVSETRVQSDGKNSFNQNTKNQHANVKTNQSKHKDSNSSRGACVSENSTKSKGNNIDSSVIIDPLLSYILFSLQSATNENVQKAVLGHFTPSQISEAKDILWENCEDSLGKKPRRVGSSARPDHEAHLHDILTALEKLDRSQKLPNIVINAFQLNLIPRSHPEELNNISLLDRLNMIEKRLSVLQTCTDRVIADNMIISEKLIQTRDYSSVLQSNTKSNFGSTRSQDNKVRAHTKSPPPVQRITKPSAHTTDSLDKLYRLPPPAKSPLKEPKKNKLPVDHISESPGVQNMDDLSAFQYPKRRKRRNIVTGKATSNNFLKGAPEPSRDIFVYRADKSTTVDMIQSHLIEKGIMPVNSVCVSNPDAKFKSFKISVPVSQCNAMFNPDIWPEGIRIRRFYHPKNSNNGGTRNN